MNDLRTRITLPFLIFVTPVLVWLVPADRPAPHRSAVDVIPHRKRFRGHGLEPGQLLEFFQRADLLATVRRAPPYIPSWSPG
jgi:hypothetical protein